MQLKVIGDSLMRDDRFGPAADMYKAAAFIALAQGNYQVAHSFFMDALEATKNQFGLGTETALIHFFLAGLCKEANWKEEYDQHWDAIIQQMRDTRTMMSLYL